MSKEMHNAFIAKYWAIFKNIVELNEIDKKIFLKKKENWS